MLFKSVWKSLLSVFTSVCVPVCVASAGAPIVIPEDYQNYKEAKTDFTANGPTLIFSDSPEMVYENGILYRDMVEGRVRLFFHHVNAVASPKKLAVMLKNKSSLYPVSYTVDKKGVAGKTDLWVKDGQEAERHYFEDRTASDKKTIGLAGSQELLSGKGVLLKQDELLTGIIDITLESQAELSVLMCEPKTDLDIFNTNAKVLPMDEHPLRGTFPKADWNYRLTSPVKPKANMDIMLKLASAETGFIKGIDKTTGLAAEDYGNYGVIYNVDFEVKGKQKVQFIINPIGGIFCGYGVLVNKTTGQEQMIALPPASTSFGETVEDAMEIAVLDKGEYRFIWSPPGAGNLPVRLFWRAVLKDKDQR